jgi:hypothetical protein
VKSNAKSILNLDKTPIRSKKYKYIGINKIILFGRKSTKGIINKESAMCLL